MPARPGATAPATLVGTVWRATSVGGQPTVVGSEPTATFTATEVNGTTGCNAYGGSYTYADGAITVGPMRMTLMACSGAIGEVEGRFTQAMAGATTARTTDSVHLFLDGSGGSIEFVAIIT